MNARKPNMNRPEPEFIRGLVGFPEKQDGVLGSTGMASCRHSRPGMS